ncbi:condensation domain-containing protein [Streptomyces sp. NPDC002755]|uniref:condensation domain-containing protein n=1 Tax=Streptomyces sp. NPDC002884 TaxID=3154544 RepID=UPI003320D530
MKTTTGPEHLALPLSSRQEWCWEWERCYNEPYPAAVSIDCSTALRLLGPLDAGALREAFTEVTLHHDALRLRLDGPPDRAADIVRPHQTLRGSPLPLEEALLPARPHALLVDLSTRPFDVTEALGRAYLLRAAPDHHVLLTSFHHLVFDAASHRLFLGDLARAYNRRVTAGEPLRPAFSYLDLIRDESTRPALDDRAARLAARAVHLQAYGAGHLLPGRTTGSPPLRHRYDEEPLDLPTGQTRQLLHAARAARVSLYSLLAAAFAGALGRHFGRARMILSTPSHGRLRPEHRTAVGDFANMVQIPIDVSHGGGHRLLRHAHEAVREAAATVGLPFGRLAETVLGRIGSAGFFRYALAHAELRLHGVTGWAVDRQRDDATPWHGMRTDVMPMRQDFSRLTYATRQASDAAAATLSLSLTMTQDARLSGALRHETGYHGPDTARSVLDHLRERLGALSDPART